MQKEETETILRDEIQKNAERYGIQLAVLFGSAASGRTHFASDVDVAIMTDARLSPMSLAELATTLTERLKKTVDIVDLRNAPPSLLREVALHGHALYEQSAQAFSLFRINALRRYIESKPLRAMRRASLDMFLAHNV